MKQKNIYNILITGILLLAISCGGKDDPIPPAPPRPDPPRPPDVEYNIPEFVPRQEGTPFDTFRGLVMTGYQGWFCAPARHAVRGNPAACAHSTAHPAGPNYAYRTEWYHYRTDSSPYGFRPGPRRHGIDMWPYMRHYEVAYHPPGFYHPDGRPALVFSSYDESTVMLHFRWMRDYGIDGAFVQRFVAEITNSQGREHFNTVLRHTMRASNRYQRAISVMYDLSGARPDQFPAVLADARMIMDTYRLQDRSYQQFYLHENGKPLIAVWGVGFSDGRAYDMGDVITLVDGLREIGFSIMLGVPTHWREGRNDAVPDPRLQELIRSADVVMPWFVGRYNMHTFPNFHELIRQDIAWGRVNNVEYAPLVFAGISDLNMYPHHNHRVERYGGQFFWNQVYHSIRSGAQMLYLAMFDEIDEGTALFKVVNNRDVPLNVPERDYWVTRRDIRGDGRLRFEITYTDRSHLLNQSNLAPATWPANQTVHGEWSRRVRGRNSTALPGDLEITFIGIEDHLPVDHYLWLSGQARRMLRGEIPLSRTLPVRN